jgi:ribosomal protein S18 acetylase RimI-like enzyme
MKTQWNCTSTDHSSLPSPWPSLRIELASDAAALRAAAYLRATSFYTYPSDRSAFSTRAHQRMKADGEWETLTKKVAGLEPNYKRMKVCCFVASINDEVSPVAAEAASEMIDLSSKLPASSTSTARIVIGTLDLNIGAVLPAEELVGRMPEAGGTRAYLSNVCVSRAARRRGIAKDLAIKAEEFARSNGVEALYVHVVVDNGPAMALYKNSLGFELEAEESESFAHSLNRPRRQLLFKRL